MLLLINHRTKHYAYATRLGLARHFQGFVVVAAGAADGSVSLLVCDGDPE